MSAANVVIVVIGLGAVAAFLVWLIARRNDPEGAATHEGPDRHGSARFFGDVDDRPGSPGAEAMGVAGPGEPAPGPSAETEGPGGG